MPIGESLAATKRVELALGDGGWRARSAALLYNPVEVMHARYPRWRLSNGNSHAVARGDRGPHGERPATGPNTRMWQRLGLRPNRLYDAEVGKEM